MQQPAAFPTDFQQMSLNNVSTQNPVNNKSIEFFW